MNDDQDTPPAGVPRTALPGVARPWPLDQDRERGTDPHIVLSRLKARAKVEEVKEKKQAQRRPWYAAGLTTIMLSVAGAITYSFTKADRVEKATADVTQEHDKRLDAFQKRLEDEKVTHDDLKRIEDKVDQLLLLMPKGKR